MDLKRRRWPALLRSTGLGETTSSSFPCGLLVTLVVALAVYAFGVWWGIERPTLVGWAIDEIVPRNVLATLDSRFSSGWPLRYPPLHIYLLSVLFLPFAVVDVVGHADVWTPPITNVLFLVGRAVSVLMALGVLVATYVCGRDLLGDPRRPRAVLAVVFVAFSLPMVYYAKTVNLDVPYTFWVAWSFVFLVRLAESHELRDYLAFALFAALAVCTKDQAYGLYVLVAPSLVLALVARGRRRGLTLSEAARRAALDRRLWWSLAVAAGVFLLVHNVALNGERFLQHVREITGPASTEYAEFGFTPADQLRMAALAGRQVLYAFGIPVVALALVGAWKLRRADGRHPGWALLGIAVVSYYLSFIAIIGYTYDRFYLPVGIVLGLLAAYGLGGSLLARRDPIPWAQTIIAAVVAYTVVRGATVDVLLASDSRYAVHAWMDRNIPVESRLYAVGHAQYLPNLARHPDTRVTALPSIEDLESWRPDFVITTSLFDRRRFRPGEAAWRFFSTLETAGQCYEKVLDVEADPPLGRVPDYSLRTNLGKIGPRIRIFRREDTACRTGP